MLDKVLRGKSPWGIAMALFLVACGIKGYYLAQQHYHILFSDEVPGSYNLAETFGLREILGRLFFACDYTLGSCRPFFANLLYVFTFKGFGYEPQTVLIMGILVGSLVVPLFFLVVAALLNVEVAVFASVMLMWMTDYVYQSIALTTIMPGILFIVGAVLAAIRYHRRGGVGFLYLSGWLMSMSVFCRYENVFLLPAFVGYELLFDKKGGFFSKIVYVLLCTSSSLYILYCNFQLYGDPFHMTRVQAAEALRSGNAPAVPMAKAFEIVWRLLRKLLGPLFWGAAAAGMILMIKRYKRRALWLFSGALVLLLFLTYERKVGRLDSCENYFFLMPLIALPLGLECVRTLFAGLGRRRIYGVVALGAVALYSVVSFHGPNVRKLNDRWNYPHELIQLTEALKGIPAASVLYIDNIVNRPGFNPPEVLVYLKRNPQKYVSGPGGVEPQEQEYYLLTFENRMESVPQEEAVKVRDYRAYGYDGLALYRVTRSGNGSDKSPT